MNSHRGHDPGALELARLLAKSLSAPLEFETVSRLLIELNRTLGHPRIFSEFSRPLSEDVRQRLIDQIYHPYRDRVTQLISGLSGFGAVVHLSIHSFTPIMHGKTRRTDLGLLFDPARTFELEFAQKWRSRLKRQFPEWAIHFNLPYRGTSDGFTTALRQQFPNRKYAGIELEVNQKFAAMPSAGWRRIQQGIAESLSNCHEW